MKLGSSHVQLPGPRNLVVQAFISFTFLILVYHHLFTIPAHPIFEITPGPTNATLGFGKIYVSTDDASTWRVQGLRQVAREYNLDLTIPIQRRRNGHEIEEYLKGDDSGAIPNQARCVLSHVAIMEMFVATGLETALILEDDADFSVNIKSQMQSLSKGLLSNLANQSTGADQPMLYPYGRDVWDILWLGHFGIEFADGVQVAHYDDAHALPWPDLHSDFNDYYKQQANGGNKQQQLVLNVAPMATYGYALTRSHAMTLLKQFMAERPPRIDVAMHVDCKGKKYRWMAPVPELVHHHKVAGQRSIEHEGVKDGLAHDLDWWKTRHKYTYNVNGSARCNAAQIGEKSANLWQCLPNQHDETI